MARCRLTGVQDTQDLGVNPHLRELGIDFALTTPESAVVGLVPAIRRAFPGLVRLWTEAPGWASALAGAAPLVVHWPGLPALGAHPL